VLPSADIAANIRIHAGRAMLPTLADGYRYLEVDFLGIGCRKPRLDPALSRLERNLG
jgi:hypothetical protein